MEISPPSHVHFSLALSGEEKERVGAADEEKEISTQQK